MTEQTIGNYKILEKIGSGGMGDVFRGLDVMLEREVAIKSLRPELSQREDLINRFRSEAVAMGRLSHPNIATVYNFLYQGGQYFLVMEFVRGQTLDTILEQNGPMPYTEVLPLLCTLLDGLEHAHRLGIVHRDIKPANIMMTPAGPKLMDFGIARILQQARQTRSGHMVGTLEYMSPEHIQGLDTDARTDIYSVGIVAYELLTGKLPFRKETDYEMIKAQVEEIPQPLRTFTADIPEDVERAVEKALEKDAAKRYQSAAAFAEALAACLGDQAPAWRHTGSQTVPGEWASAAAPGRGGAASGSSKRLIWGIGGLAVVLLLVGLALFVLPSLEGPSGSSDDAVSRALPLDKLTRAAEGTDLRAQLELGNRYATGQGVAKDSIRALTWYRKAAAGGLAEADLQVGKAYLLGLGVPPDPAQAKDWLLKAAQADVPGAAAQLGLCYDKLGQYDNALEWFLKSNEQGDKKAPLNIGYAYVNTGNYAKAVPWLEKAAAAGAAEATFSLGMIYYNGFVGGKDYAKARQYFAEAANRNQPESQFMLGIMYRYGYGVAVDRQAAIKWLKLAKANGYAGAAKELRSLQ